jgi:riboflavin kinase / FMN adenylyltransferase
LRRTGLALVDHPTLLGEVVHGAGRGHEIGFPTANILIASDDTLSLPEKTFSCRVRVDEKTYLGAGVFRRMTPDLLQHTYQNLASHAPSPIGVFEVHILDFDADIYGQTISVDILDVIRDNHVYKNLEELIVQIKKDVNHVRAHWSRALM